MPTPGGPWSYECISIISRENIPNSRYDEERSLLRTRVRFDGVQAWDVRTIVDPTATLTLNVNWSLTETLIDVMHSIDRIRYTTRVPRIRRQTTPASDPTVGNNIKPIHSLLIVGERPSIESIIHSELRATSCSERTVQNELEQYHSTDDAPR